MSPNDATVWPTNSAQTLLGQPGITSSSDFSIIQDDGRMKAQCGSGPTYDRSQAEAGLDGQWGKQRSLHQCEGLKLLQIPHPYKSHRSAVRRHSGAQGIFISPQYTMHHFAENNLCYSQLEIISRWVQQRTWL